MPEATAEEWLRKEHLQEFGVANGRSARTCDKLWGFLPVLSETLRFMLEPTKLEIRSINSPRMLLKEASEAEAMYEGFEVSLQSLRRVRSDSRVKPEFVEGYTRAFHKLLFAWIASFGTE